MKDLKGIRVCLELKANLGPEGPAGKQGPMGERADAGNVIDVMGIYVPILVAKRYLAKMGFVKYLINKSGSSYRIVNHGIQTLVNMSNYHEPTRHFDATFVPGPHTKRGKPAQYYTDLEMSSYKCPYDLAFNKVTAIYFVYQIRKYDGAGPEHNCLVSCVSGNNYYGLCFIKDEWGKNFMRIWGIQGKKLSYYKDIHTFPTSANDPCELGRWNVACIVFDTKKTPQIHHYGSIMERFVISHVILHSTTAYFTYSTISNPTTQQVSMATSLVWIFLVTSSQYRSD